MADVGEYYTIPVILSFDGIDKQVNSSLGKSFSTAGAKGGKDFTQSFAKSSQADIKKLGDTYSKMYDKAADAADKLKVAQAGVKDLVDKGITSGKRYEAALAGRNKATRDEARLVRESADAYKDLEHAQSNLGKGGTSAGSEVAHGFLDGFGGPIEAIGSKAGPIGAALAAAAGLGLAAGGLLATQVMAGLEREAASDKIQARFGLDEATMAKFGEAGGQAYAANFGDSISGNIEAAAVALQNGLLPKDATEQQTQGVVEQLSTVATVLGVEIPEAARSAGQLMKTGFAKDFKSAADLIVSGSQSGLNISEDWLDTVNEYSTQFRKLGISGPEALGLLSQAVKGGARDTDVAADALKEFSIRSVDGSKTTVDGFTKIGLNADLMAEKFAKGGPAAHDALGQVLDGLRNIKDPAEQSRIAVELFGTQAEDLGGALNNFDLSTATQQLGEVDGAAQRASDTLGGNTASGVESAKRNIELAVSTMQTSLADAFGPTLQKGVDWVTTHQDDIVHFFEITANGAVKLTGAITGMVGDILVVFGNLYGGIGDAVGFVLDGFETITGAAATLADALGQDALAATLRNASTELGTMSDGFHAAGEDIISVGHGMAGFGTDLQHVTDGLGSTGNNAKAAADQVERVRATLAALPGGKDIDITAIVTYKDQNGLVIGPDQLLAPKRVGAVPGDTYRGPGRAAGGSIAGPGGPTSDVIPIWASNGEHMLPADEVQMLGGQQGVYNMRGMIRAGAIGKFAGGGAIAPDVLAAQALAGTPYSQGSRNDCSGMAARVIARALGLPEVGLMSTKNASQWLSKLGFQSGIGGPGQLSVGWYDHGPNPNDGHMALTLSDGTNAEAGGKNGVFTLGANAAGANSPQFDQHMFLPNLFGEGAAGSVGSLSTATGGGTAGVGPNGESGTYSVDQSEVAEANSRVAEADARVRESEAKQRELKADAKESEKIAAQADVDKAKADADKARKELGSAQQGKFTPNSKGGKGGGDLSELGKIFGGGLLETFGLDGSLFPDIGNLMPVQMANTLLGALVPQGGSDASAMAATSSSPFGLPDIAVPPAPQGTPASGAGMGPLPGPAGPTTIIDQSIHGGVNGSIDQVMKQRDAGLSRAIQRIPVQN